MFQSSFLRSLLTGDQQREIDDVRRAAQRILDQPLDQTFTDHTIAHPDRILGHLDWLLRDWANQEIEFRKERAQAEIFILLGAVYLHDIGMQFQLFDACPSIEKHLPTLAEELKKSGYLNAKGPHPFTPETLEFARKHHHHLAYDWINSVNLHDPRELLPFADTGLKTYVDHVARVAWSHNEWLTTEKSYKEYQQALVDAQEQEGRLRICTLASFLRMGDLLDLDYRRVDVKKLQRFGVPAHSKAHWWRHHFIRTCRLDEQRGTNGRRLHLVFTVPHQHEKDIDWIKEALCAATIDELHAEQERSSRWLAPAGVWIDLPEPEECEVKLDKSGKIFPIPADTLDIFRKTWGRSKGEVAQVQIQNALDQGTLRADDQGDRIRTLGVWKEIDDYLAQIANLHDPEFRDTPYTPIELDYGEFHNALDALEALIRQPQVMPTPGPVVVLGDPGGGKTTLVRRYVLDCARRQRTPEYVPIYVQANRYGNDAAWAEAVDKRLGTALKPSTPEEYRAATVELVQQFLVLMADTLCDLAKVSRQHRPEMLEYLRDVMARTTCLIVVDGLNEAPPLQRGLAIFALQRFVSEYRSHRVIITSREGDYHDRYFPHSRVHHVKPLRESAVRTYWTAIGIDEAAQNRIFSLELRDVGALVRNPMYMFMLGTLLKGGATDAIDDAGRLFQRFTGESLQRWHRGDAHPWILPEEMNSLLAEVAYHALYVQEVAFGRLTLEKGVAAWFGTLTNARRNELGVPDPQAGVVPTFLADALIERMLSTGFLQRQGPADELRFTFRHHTTQDYLAAVSIAKRVDELPNIVKRPIFHESLRIVPGIIENPNAFLRHLNASTSEDVGRAALLALSFRVAGAVRGRLDADVWRHLCSGAIPILQAVAGLFLPFATEVLGYLFSHLGWQGLGRFLAQVAENADLSSTTRRFAEQRVAKAMVREDVPTREAMTALLGNAIPAGTWADYRTGRKVFEQHAAGTNVLEMFPLLLGGVASSISLTVAEKLRIVESLGRLTPNQLGTLQRIFVQEVSAWGGLSMQGGHDVTLLMVHQEYTTRLVLVEEDRAYLQGRIHDAIQGYLDAWPRAGVKNTLLERLILLSGSMSSDETNRLIELIRGYAGEVFARTAHRHGDDHSAALTVIRKHASVALVVQDEFQRLSWSANPWWLLWRDVVLTSKTGHVPGFAIRFQEIASRVEWGDSSGMIYLETARQPLSAAPIEAIERLLDIHYPDRPARKLEQLKETFRLLPRDAFVDAFNFHVVSFGQSGLDTVLAIACDAFPIEIVLAFVEGLEQVDRELHRKMQFVVLARMAASEDMSTLQRYMRQWGISLRDACNINSKADRARVVKKLYASERKSQVLAALQSDNVYDLLLELHEGDNEFEAATKSALAGLRAALSTGSDPEPFGDAIERLATKCAAAGEIDTARTNLDQLVSLALPVLGDFVNGDWAFKLLMRLHKKDHVDNDELAERIEQVLCSPYAHTTADQRDTFIRILARAGHMAAVLRCLDAYVAGCPRPPKEAADYLGNGAWQAYVAGDDARFEQLTDAALGLAPSGYCNDWLLGNKALALVLRGDEAGAMEAYAVTRNAVADRQRWQAVAVDDLEQHASRRAGAQPIHAEFVTAVRALGVDLPEKTSTTT